MSPAPIVANERDIVEIELCQEIGNHLDERLEPERLKGERSRGTLVPVPGSFREGVEVD